MQRLKDEGLDPSKADFSVKASSPNRNMQPEVLEIQMTKPGVNRKISIAELKSPEAKENAWFVVRGEVRSRSEWVKITD
jgi:nitrate reductase (NAD(P)H)